MSVFMLRYLLVPGICVGHRNKCVVFLYMFAVEKGTVGLAWLWFVISVS